jgi:hypothetical protein
MKPKLTVIPSDHYAAERNETQMKTHVARRITVAAALLLCVVAPVGRASGQTQPASASRSVPVTLVLIPEMDYGDAAAVLLRRPNGAPADVILLRAEAATPEALSEAIGGLLVIRKARGDAPSGTDPQVLRLTAMQQVRQISWAATVLRRLAAAEPREVQGVGRHRALEILLPAQQARD